MPSKISLLTTISRAEFILPNLGSLIMGLAWGVRSPIGIDELVILILVSFTVINLSSAIGAQVNTLSDHDLDSRDERKRSLVTALNVFGTQRLQIVILIEFILALTLVSVFAVTRQNFLLLLLWIVGISLGTVYSLPPLRLKAKSWLAPVSLMLVLAIFPVLFAYFAFTTEMNPFFLLSLTGLPLTVYSVIIPTEIRDYFGDKAMGIETMTVRLGLVHASMLSIALLILGALFTGTAFVMHWISTRNLWLNIFVLAIPVAVVFVVRKIKQLHTLSHEYETSNDKDTIAWKIMSFSSNNPQWIMILTQTYSALSIILLLSKFLFNQY
jgi:4-hydroxybenzoate polyprenyltransferase